MDRSTLRGKTALITGVSRQAGIGAAVARRLAQEGANVFTSYYRPYDASMPWGSQETEATEIIHELRRTGVKAAGIELDLAEPGAAAQLFDAAEEALGAVHILVNNAAYSTHTPIQALTAEELDRHYAVNVRAMALLCAEFVRRYPGGPGGRIINLTSGQSVDPMPDELAYAATKGAVEAFTVSLSVAAAPIGITVNAIDPGATDTGWMTPEFKRVLMSQAPMGRVGLPDDAANLIAFLASTEAGWITGQVLHSRGGM